MRLLTVRNILQIESFFADTQPALNCLLFDHTGSYRSKKAAAL